MYSLHNVLKSCTCSNDNGQSVALLGDSNDNGQSVALLGDSNDNGQSVAL